MVILVNRYSASASEIVSACLQDHKRATVIGQRTWGKGSVQNIIRLEDGKSALKLTTAGYLRPSGKNIHKRSGSKPEDEWGVSPDEGFEVELTSAETRKIMQVRRARDVLKKRTAEEKQASPEDPQLAKALDHLRELLTKQGDGGPTAPKEKTVADGR